MVELESINCDQCGAPLEVPETISFVKCGHCDTRLAIRRTDSATFTERLDSLESGQRDLKDQVKRLEIQNRLQLENRLWDKRQKSFMMRDKHGREYLPSVEMSYLFLIVGVVAGLFGMIVGFSNQHAAFFLFGVFALVAGLVGAAVTYSKAKDFHAARRAHFRRKRQISKEREEVVPDLDKLKTPAEFLKDLESQE